MFSMSSSYIKDKRVDHGQLSSLWKEFFKMYCLLLQASLADICHSWIMLQKKTKQQPKNPPMHSPLMLFFLLWSRHIFGQKLHLQAEILLSKWAFKAKETPSFSVVFWHEWNEQFCCTTGWGGRGAPSALVECFCQFIVQENAAVGQWWMLLSLLSLQYRDCSGFHP